MTNEPPETFADTSFLEYDAAACTADDESRRSIGEHDALPPENSVENKGSTQYANPTQELRACRVNEHMDFPKATETDEKSENPPLFRREGPIIRCFWHDSIPCQKIIPMTICILALALTGFSCWGCTFFRGAKLSFTSGDYGLWSLRDGNGQCQLWGVLFFNDALDPYLQVARISSMFALLLGMSMTVVLTQALQLHAMTWSVGVAFVGVFLWSVFTTKRFNLWSVFFLSTYAILVLIVRLLFIHPVHRKTSARGRNAIATIFVLNSFFCAAALWVLKSDFCGTCQNITADVLQGRGEGCGDSKCSLGPAGWSMVTSSFLWIMASVAVALLGVQGDELKPTARQLTYAHYPTHSIRTQIYNTGAAIKRVAKKAVHRGSLPMFEDDVEHQGSEQDDRSRCQKCCLDYRVTPRTCKQSCRFVFFRAILWLLIVVYALLIYVLIGSFVENKAAQRAPDTSYNFVTDEVCAFNPLDPQQEFVTLPSKQDAVDRHYQVAHCGSCGFCSNPTDIRTYIETRKTVAQSAKKCGPKAVLGSEQDLFDCLEGRIGFTPSCTQCWVENMQSTKKHCLLTCISTLLNGFMTNNNVDGAGDKGWLNQCIFCDEKQSGPAFVKCSGVARRRLGIQSEIDRNPREQCQSTDVDWVSVDLDELFMVEN